MSSAKMPPRQCASAASGKSNDKAPEVRWWYRKREGSRPYGVKAATGSSYSSHIGCNSRSPACALDSAEAPGGRSSCGAARRPPEGCNHLESSAVVGFSRCHIQYKACAWYRRSCDLKAVSGKAKAGKLCRSSSAWPPSCAAAARLISSGCSSSSSSPEVPASAVEDRSRPLPVSSPAFPAASSAKALAQRRRRSLTEERSCAIVVCSTSRLASSCW
mmetsp:Transcript_26848/g.77670  ORF Transcript_26848/g.77670 Transcript_26848/m.77670 type:complete len:217 (-) Transcript_26848:619-1269(-)